MEVNKEQAEKCRDLGAAALRRGEFDRAARMLEKSLRLHPLPGVPALLEHAVGKLRQQQQQQAEAQQQKKPAAADANGSSTAPPSSSATNSSSNNREGRPFARSGSSMSVGADGREYTADQSAVVRRVLDAKKGGRGAHYRVLQIAPSAAESEIKKAYRKLSLKVHPDKNSAPHADEAFKAVGLAYATLSDPQKRHIYDHSGEEDPDNRGGAGGGMHFRRRGGGGGPEMTPEEIFNAFFGGGGMPAGGPGGMHFYSTGFGPGMHFGGPARRRPQQQPQQQQQQQQAGGIGMLLQLMPIIVILLMSFFSPDMSSYPGGGARTMPGENQYFSLVRNTPFSNPLKTKLSKVKEIPYFVTDKFLRTYARDRFQLSKVEYMVEKAYENYLVNECSLQKKFKQRLNNEAQKLNGHAKEGKLKQAKEFELSRCDELTDLFPERSRNQKTHR